MNRRIFYIILVLFFLVTDKLSKYLIVKNIALYDHKVIIPGFLNFTHIRNRGVIFGLFSQSSSDISHIILLIIQTAAIILVIYFFLKTPYSDILSKISLSLITAGALGNLSDRIVNKYVVDFIDIYIKQWNWAIFNVADSCITIGAILMMFVFIFKRREKCIQSS